MKSGRYEVILKLNVYLLPDKLYNCEGTVFIIDYIIAQINDMLYIHINKIIFDYNMISCFIRSNNCRQNIKATQVMLLCNTLIIKRPLKCISFTGKHTNSNTLLICVE